ncbi:FtsK/SpoIIIE domain-containing protein [Mycoplasma sp. E35C]|uniref:FtsK/SpoIIIE domain-containing protein n=1 Tax=Mycoplasma sp. E35C TaxID=2801918 RepID=UPI001CA43728|nr:FtsK/SpoIIIE domain-containing protein [Mycoplasma sp. E35C]QZX49217.1 cell division protein FtsK [Mycoplasma sp. E35C]
MENIKERVTNFKIPLTKKNHVIRVMVSAFLMVLLFLSFFRAPYFGEVIDGVIFDLLFFGTAKYIAYFILFTVLIILMLPNPIILRFYRSKLVWWFILFVDIFILLLFGVAHYFIYWKSVPDINLNSYVQTFFENWKKYSGVNGEWLWQLKGTLVSGGMINSLFIAINAQFPALIAVELALLFLAVIIIFVGVYFNIKGFIKFKNKLIKVMGGVINKDFIPLYDRLYQKDNQDKPQEKTFVEPKQVDDVYHETGNLQTKELSFSQIHKTVYKQLRPLELKQVSINEQKNNESFLENIATKLEKLFRKAKIRAKLIEKKCGPTEVKLIFEFADRNQIKEIKNLKQQFIDIFETSVVNVSQKGDIVELSTSVFNQSKIALTDVMPRDDGIYRNELNCAIGIDENFHPINYDLKKEKCLLFVGGLGSGKMMCAISALTSLVINRSPNDLQLCIIDSPNSKLSKLKDLPHLVNEPINSVEGGNNLFETIINEVKYRTRILRDHNVDSIDQFNKNNMDNRIKDMVIYINDLNDYLDYDFSYMFKFISHIHKVANKLNIYLILVTNKIANNMIDDELIKCYGKIINLKVDTEEESKMLINKNSLYKLYKNGDLYIIDPLSREIITRGLSCFIDNQLLDSVITHYTINYEKH